MGFTPSRITIELPSGNSVVVRRIAPADMIACGLTPSLLEDIRSEASPDTTLRVRALLEGIVCRACVEPKFSMTDGNDVWVGELTYDELDLIAGGIFKASGITTEAKKELSPLSETKD